MSCKGRDISDKGLLMKRQFWRRMAGPAFALRAFVSPAVAAEDDQLHATVDHPATITATRGAAVINADTSPSVVIRVDGYKPAENGGVRAVVKAQKPDGQYQYIGTFGVTGEFKPQSHRIALPQELAGGPVKLKVELVPLQPRSSGAGAHLEIGGAEVQGAPHP
jgi:hypothetical protein